jgi:malate synthase
MVEGKPAARFLTPGLIEILKEKRWKENGPRVQVKPALSYYVRRAKVPAVEPSACKLKINSNVGVTMSSCEKSSIPPLPQVPMQRNGGGLKERS